MFKSGDKVKIKTWKEILKLKGYDWNDSFFKTYGGLTVKIISKDYFDKIWVCGTITENDRDSVKLNCHELAFVEKGPKIDLDEKYFKI